MKMQLLFVILLLITLTCSREITSVTETDSGSITGWVVDDEKQGIPDALVLLRSTEIIQETTTSALPHALLAKQHSRIKVTVDSLRTSHDGSFAFDSVARGTYYLEVNAHDSSGAVLEVSLDAEASEHSVDTVTAGKLGAIRGSMNVALLPSDSTFIYVVELDRRVNVDSTGYFSIDKVPASEYHFQLVENTSLIPSLLDLIVIPVSQQDTTEVFGIGVEKGSLDINGTVQE